MSSELVTVTIDGVPVQVAKGTMIIEAAKHAGVLVPHYCYHPSLPSPAVCRMCLVEVEKAPKLMPACVTAVAEGQVVHVRLARRQGGARRRCWNSCSSITRSIARSATRRASASCRTSSFRRGGRVRATVTIPSAMRPSRTSVPTCCTCPIAAFSARAACASWTTWPTSPCSRSTSAAIARTSGSMPTQPLDHPWSGNVVDLCPVGSLISKDFLHKARAWDLDKTASICPGCTQGCNMTIDTRDSTVVRLAPAPQSRRQPPLHVRYRSRRLSLDESRRPGRGAAPARGRAAARLRLGRRARAPGVPSCATRMDRSWCSPAGARRVSRSAGCCSLPAGDAARRR